MQEGKELNPRQIIMIGNREQVIRGVIYVGFIIFREEEMTITQEKERLLEV